MKLLLIQPSHFNSDGTVYKTKKSLFPSLTLPYLAALTPSDIKIAVVDDHIDEIDFKTDADLIGIPTRVLVSKKTLEQKSVEVKERNEKEAKMVKIKDVDKLLKY